MKYIIQALRTTYHTERKANTRLNDLINLLEQDLAYGGTSDDVHDLLEDIDVLLHDINLPVQENKDTVYLYIIDGVKMLCSNAYAYECAKDGYHVIKEDA